MDATHSTFENLHEYRRGACKAEAAGQERHPQMKGGRTEASDGTSTPSRSFFKIETCQSAKMKCAINGRYHTHTLEKPPWLSHCSLLLFRTRLVSIVLSHRLTITASKVLRGSSPCARRKGGE